MQFFIARGGQNLCCPIPWELAWGLMYEKSVFKRVIKGGQLLFVFVIKWLIILGPHRNIHNRRRISGIAEAVLVL